MTATRTPGLPVIEDGKLISTNPATGVEVGRFPVAGPEEVAAAVTRARAASVWWAELGFTGRRDRLLPRGGGAWVGGPGPVSPARRARLRRWRASLANRMDELAALMHQENGKPVAE